MTPSIFYLDESSRKQTFADRYMELSQNRNVHDAYERRMTSLEKIRDDCYYIKFTNGGWYIGPRDRHSDADRGEHTSNDDFFAFTTADGVPHVFDVSTNEKLAKVAEVLEHFIKTGVIDMHIGDAVILQDDEDFTI